MEKLQLKNLTKVFQDGRELFKDLSLTVGQEDFLVIIGPSGCGKTTLLRIIAGLEKATKGEIWADDVEISNYPPQERKVGMIFQDYALYPHMTVFGNLSFALEIQKMKKKDRQMRVAHTAEKTGIAAHLKKYPNQLSGGERQRTAIGRAMAADCDLYLCDEPLSNLHPELRKQIREELSELHKELKKPMIYVTHEQADVMTLATKAIVMKDGEIQQYGTPEELYDRPENCFVAGFFGTPPMNFLEVEIALGPKGEKFLLLGDDRLNISDAAAMEHYGENKVIIGIRPDSVIPFYDKAAEGNLIVNGTVSGYDNMGACLWIHVNVAGQEIMLKEQGTLRTAVGKEIQLSLRQKELHFFDINTQKRLK